MFDDAASVQIREGQGVNGDWIFAAQFDLNTGRIRYKDLKKMFKNSVEKAGGVPIE